MKVKIAGVGLTLVVAAVVAAVAVGAGGSASASSVVGNIVIAGVPGGDTGTQPVDILSFQWGVGRTPTGANFRDLTVVKAIDKASPKLALLCASGDRLPVVTVDVVRSDGATYMEYKLEDVMVTSVQHGGSGDITPTESVSFNYTKITWTHTSKGGSKTQTSWDVAANRAT